MQKNVPFIGEILPAGVVAGLIAGIGMAVVVMIMGGVTGMGFFFPIDLIGATVFGPNAILGGPLVLVTGVVIHLIVSVIYGIIFSAAIVRRETSTLAAFWLGIAFSVVVFYFMNFVILPFTNPTMSARMAWVSGPFFFEHLVYGGLLMVTPTLRQGFQQKHLRILEQPTHRTAA